MSYRFTHLDKEKIDGLHRYIETHLSQPLPSSELCRQARMSRDKLNAGWKLLFGTTPSTSIRVLRMQRAQLLLQDTDRPIKEIAGLCGYHNSKSFHKAFRKYFAQTPLQIRTSAQGTTQP